jgi:hypothetical protein
LLELNTKHVREDLPVTQEPKERTDTFNPVRPRNLYFMFFGSNCGELVPFMIAIVLSAGFVVG